MKTVTYQIPNISCNHCVHTVEMEVGNLEGVEEVNADVDSKQATITFDDPATEENIKQLLARINYPAEVG